MRGLDPRIHVFGKQLCHKASFSFSTLFAKARILRLKANALKTWVPVSSTGMTTIVSKNAPASVKDDV
jgi:hypothetical protein